MVGIRSSLALVFYFGTVGWIVLCFRKLSTIFHYSGVIMGAMASQITGFMIVCLTIYSGTDQRKRQSSASLVFVRGIHWWPMDSPHNGPVKRKMFQFDDVIMSGILQPCKIQNWKVTGQSLHYFQAYGQFRLLRVTHIFLASWDPAILFHISVQMEHK